jgi:predicted nuclease with RNAse H fold
MLIAGVDLAAEPKGTALALIDWAEGGAKLVHLALGVNDEGIIDAAKQATKIGIDCALGWPIEFVDFVVAHSQIKPGASPIDGGIDWRRRMAYRETDRQVREITGRWPLSVSTDRLGLTAMRCAGLLSKMQQSGLEVDRSGAGRVVEIYPGASLRLWGFDTTGYRISNEKRADLLAQIETQAPWLELGDFAELMVQSCDAFDAVIAALATRSAALGHYQKPNETQLHQAQIEGWIALPSEPLRSLAAQGV